MGVISMFKFRSRKDKMIPLNPDSPDPSVMGDAVIDPKDPPPLYRLMEKTFTHLNTGHRTRPHKVRWDVVFSSPYLDECNAHRTYLLRTHIHYSYDNLEIWPSFEEYFGEGVYGHHG